MGDDRPSKPSSSPSEGPTSPDPHRATPTPVPSGSGAVLDPLIGCSLGGCIIIERIARGGMGVVYKGVQSGTDRVVAIKTMRPEGTSRMRIEAFIREAKLAANNPHDNLVVVYEAGVESEVLPEPVPFLVMEFLPDAHDIISYAHGKRLSHRERLDAFLKVCDAAQHLHSRGIAHFDIKPSNILVDARGRIRLTDLGLARTLAESPLGRPGGTFTHMSPEQLYGDPEALDNRCDVYALGVVLFELLTGRLPYRIPVSPNGLVDARAAFEKLSGETPPSLARIDASLADLDPIVARAIEPDRDRRYPSVEAMVSDLRSVREKRARAEASGARRPRALGVLCALGVVIGASVVAHVASRTLFADWTPIQGWWGRRLTSAVSPVALDAPLDNVAIVALTDETDLDGLASRYGLALDPASRRSLRLLHAQLCRALAESGARCLVFDILFATESAFDADFASGIDDAVSAGIPVVLGARNWWVDGEGRPEISPVLWRRGVEWGGIKVSEIDPTGDICIPLIVENADGAIFPSLSLAAYASARADGALRDLSFDESGRAVEISFWQARADRPDKRVGAAPSERVPLTWIQPLAGGTRLEGRTGTLRSTDVLGMYRPVQFSRSSLDDATYDVSDVLNADPVQLRRWFDDRIVIVGDLTTEGGDFISRADGPWPGCYFHAIGIESLMRNIHPRVPARATGMLATGACAGLGVLIGFPRRGGADPGRGRLPTAVLVAIRAGALALGIVAILAASVVAYDQFMLLWSPFKPVLAFILGSMTAIILIPRLA